MAILNNTGIRMGASGAGGGDAYQIEKSLRFNPGDNPYLENDLSSASTTHTVSFWLKNCMNTTALTFDFYFSCNTSPYCAIAAYENQMYLYNGAHNISSGCFLRDPSAWYHVLVSADSGTATLYVNNEQIHSVTGWSFGGYSRIGGHYGGGYPINGLISEFHYIDGTALDADSFGETNATTGQWVPIEYTGGSYGTDGFYLKFDNASDLGEDSSGEDNDWTPEELETTAGVDNDQLTDTPTPFNDELNGTGNYCTWNPLCITTTANSLAQGNLEATHTADTGWAGGLGTNGVGFIGTIGMTSGKWYFEVIPTAGSDTHWSHAVGITPVVDGPQYAGYLGNGIGHSASYVYNHDWEVPSSPTQPSAFELNDTLGVAVDMDNGFVWFSINGDWANSGDPTDDDIESNGAFGTGFEEETMYPVVTSMNSTDGFTSIANFGQRPFDYTPPDGFKALNTYNLDDTEITSGEYEGNADDDGPVIWMNATPATLRISSTNDPPQEGDEVTFDPDDVDPLAGGFKIRNASTNNADGTTYYWSAPTTESAFKYANAQTNE